MKPRIPITDKRFVYKDSASTNVAETFRKERERIAREQLGWRAAVLPRTQLRGI